MQTLATMKKPANWEVLTAAELGIALAQLKEWALDNPKAADHFFVSYEINPLERRIKNLNAAQEAGLLPQYVDYIATMYAYDFSVSDFDGWKNMRDYNCRNQ